MQVSTSRKLKGKKMFNIDSKDDDWGKCPECGVDLNFSLIARRLISVVPRKHWLGLSAPGVGS